LLLPSPAAAQTGVKLQLVPEVTAIVPGKPFRLGLFIQHEPGYHTYWKFPGIVGVPTTMDWKLPPGFQAGPLEYPEPEPTKMFQIKAQGFERDVLLQTVITPPADLPPGQKLTLTGKASWMACARTCHPGTLDLSLELPVAQESSPDARWSPIFAKERAAYARPSTAWTASAEEKGMTVLLKLTPQPGAAKLFKDAAEAQQVYFFTEDGWINSDEPQTVSLAPDGALSITLHRADVFLGKNRPSKLYGIVQRPGSWLAGDRLSSMVISPDLRQ
jgi:thiol:disulfide interchange protein DsbD